MYASDTGDRVQRDRDSLQSPRSQVHPVVRCFVLIFKCLCADPI